MSNQWCMPLLLRGLFFVDFELHVVVLHRLLSNGRGVIVFAREIYIYMFIIQGTLLTVVSEST